MLGESGSPKAVADPFKTPDFLVSSFPACPYLRSYIYTHIYRYFPRSRLSSSGTPACFQYFSYIFGYPYRPGIHACHGQCMCMCMCIPMLLRTFYPYRVLTYSYCIYLDPLAGYAGESALSDNFNGISASNLSWPSIYLPPGTTAHVSK